MEEEEEERATGGKTEDMGEEVWVVCMCHKSEREKKALETENQENVYLYVNDLHVLFCVQRLKTYPQSRIEEGDIQRDSSATSLSHMCLEKKKNIPPPSLSFNWTTPAELLSDSL